MKIDPFVVFFNARARPFTSPNKPPPARPPFRLCAMMRCAHSPSFTYLEQKQHYQYFGFRSTLKSNSPALLAKNGQSIRVRYVVENAGEASYADAFRGYSTFASSGSTPFDARSWTRTSDTSYEDGRLTWTHVHRLRGRGGGGGDDDDEDGGGRSSSSSSSSSGTTTSTTAYFAYFPPYSYERHLGLIAMCEGE